MHTNTFSISRVLDYDCKYMFVQPQQVTEESCSRRLKAEVAEVAERSYKGKTGVREGRKQRS